MTMKPKTDELHEIVMAIGDFGTLEPTPKAHTVEISAIPADSANQVIPATIRWFSALRNGGGIPTRIRRIRYPAGSRKSAVVEFECTPFVRYTLPSGPVMGDTSSCYLRNSKDAADPIFSRLSSKEHRRLLRAAKASEAWSLHS